MTFVDDLHCYKDSSESIQDISRHHVYRQEEWYALKNTLEKCMINSCFNASFLSYYEAEIST